MIAARFWLLRFRARLARHEAEAGITNLYDKLTHLTKEGVYGPYILANYSKNEIDEISRLLRPERDKLFNYSGLELLQFRWLAMLLIPVLMNKLMTNYIAAHLKICC
jgi:ribonucleoside-diphosphate reductase alpha chain